MYYETMLIPFDMVLDTDFSIVRAIQLMYHYNTLTEDQKSMYYSSIMDLINPSDNRYLEELLVDRPYENPISTIMKPEYLPTDAEPILERLKEKSYDNIVKTARKTAIYEMIRHGYNMKDGGFSPTILCETEIQKNVITSFLNNNGISYPCILLKDLRTLEPYGSILCKSESILQKIIENGLLIEGKNIMVSDHRYNFTDNESRSKGILNPELFKKYELMQNKLFILNIYNIDNNTVG